MLRPGASVIELIPYQFESGRGALVFSLTNNWVRGGQLPWRGWWVAVPGGRVGTSSGVLAPQPASLSPSRLLLQDTTSQVAWWVAVVCDPAISTPGPSELAGTPPEDWWPRDRNADVPWAALEAALQRVIEVGGDQRQYRQNYFAQGLHKLYLLPGGGMRWGGGCPNGTAPAGG